MRASGGETTSFERCINLPIFRTWKESEGDWSLMDVWTGCWDVRTDASWNRSFSIQWRVRTERYVFRTDNAGLSGVRSGWTHRPCLWNNGQMDVRMGWHVVRTADRESEIFYHFRSAGSFENALTSWIPVYSFFIHKWFCPNTEWGQNTNNSKTEKLDLLHSSGRSTVQASSIQMTRTFHLDLPQCQEASNCSKLHLSERLSNTSGCRSVFDQLRDFFSKHKYGKTTATVWQCVFPSKRSPSQGKSCIQVQLFGR
jgi:hypothetical protein